MTKFRLLCLLGVAIFLVAYGVATVSSDDKPGPAPKQALAPFLEVSQTVAPISVFSGPAPVDAHTWRPGHTEGHSTLLRGYGMKEVRLRLLMVKGGEESVIDERLYQWDTWPITDPPPGGPLAPESTIVQGISQVQIKNGAKEGQVSVALAVGFNGSSKWDYVRKPEELLLDTAFRDREIIGPWPGRKKPGEVHIAHVAATTFGGKSLDWNKIKSVDDIKKATKGSERIILVTTVYWVAGAAKKEE